jgi:thiol-disulfide isomerase/thioredoxin
LAQGLGALLAGPLGWAGARAAALGDAVVWPKITLLDGQPWGPAHWRDRAVVVVFFSTDCSYCERHNPRLQALADRMTAENRPLTLLGAALDRDAARVREHQRARRQHFAVTLDEAPLRPLLSPRRVTPLTCVVDRQSRLREIIPGEMTEDDVMKLAHWADPLR